MDAALKQRAITTENSFAVQYTSLILIVLAFTIGALVKPVETAGGVPEAFPPQPVEQSPTLSKKESGNSSLFEVQKPVGKLQYTDLFALESSELNLGRIDALAAVLNSHDLRAELQVFQSSQSSDESSEASLMNAFERSIALSRSLEARGVPAPAFRVRVIELMSEHQATADFYRDTLEDRNG